MTSSPLLRRLRAEDFDVRPNEGGRYFPIRPTGQARRIGEAQLKVNGEEILWLRDSDGVSEDLFIRTSNQTWKGGRCVVTEATMDACVAALHCAIAVRRPDTA
jgi:hypothetical protein